MRNSGLGSSVEIVVPTTLGKVEDAANIDSTVNFDPAIPQKSSISTLIIGCGNLLRGDDAVGPVLVRRMWDIGLPQGVHGADGGTGGMDVAFQMRGVPHVILVDACSSGSEPGAIFELPGEAVEQLPPLTGIHLHAFRWDHALAFGRWLLKEDYPRKVTVYLIEGAVFEVGQPISKPVDLAIDQLVDRLFFNLQSESAHGRRSKVEATLDFTEDGYMRISRSDAERFFPDDALVALRREEKLLLLPTRGAAAGGWMLKQRNASGDRSLLIREVFGFEMPVGRFVAEWNAEMGGLQLLLNCSTKSDSAITGR